MTSVRLLDTDESIKRNFISAERRNLRMNFCKRYVYIKDMQDIYIGN